MNHGIAGRVGLVAALGLPMAVAAGMAAQQAKPAAPMRI